MRQEAKTRFKPRTGMKPVRGNRQDGDEGAEYKTSLKTRTEM